MILVVLCCRLEGEEERRGRGKGKGGERRKREILRGHKVEGVKGALIEMNKGETDRWR